MDELRGPSIQIVLHVKEGLGFGFLRSPFIVSGSLNGYILETDPSVPTHAPIFDAELVWEADKRRFRSLRVQNVPVKIEVFSLGTQGKKDKIGYLLLSLLGAQPCPANKLVDVKHTWHRLLGVKSEGKCCQPQLMLSLTIEDRLSTPTPRNELRMFHSNEVAHPPAYSTNNTLPGTNNTLPGKTMLLTLEEYIAESKRTVSCPELQPRLQCEDGLIQIGAGRQLFVLSVTIAAIDNLDLLLPDTLKDAKEGVDCHITYSVFTHNIMTDRVRSTTSAPGQSCALNQRSSLRLRCELSSLAQYFARCPLLVATVCARDTDIGVCSLDLRKLVPTDDLQQFLNSFCNSSGALSISERCYILRCSGVATDTSRRPYVDVQLCLKYVGLQKEAEKPRILTARSATQLESSKKTEPIDPEPSLDCKSGSCTNFEQDTGRVAYTNMGASNTARYKNASGDAIIKTNEIADMIKKMCESFAESQERIMSMRVKPATSDMQIQCDQQSQDVGGITDNTQPPLPTTDVEDNTRSDVQFAGDGRVTARARDVTDDAEREPVRLETSKSDTCINQSEKEMVKQLISRADRDEIMQRFVDELEDWKEKQQQLFTCQLKRKEDYHLDLLGREWAKKRSELENKLRAGIEQCRTLAADLSRATDDFRLRGYRNCEREKKLLDAKTALEAHYTAKYQELREASQKMEDDMNHQLKMKDMRIEELEHQLMVMDKQMEVLKTNMKNCEKDAESRYSGLTKDQTASLIQELRCLEEKLDSATQSKSFFKEQWGRCVRELHQLKLTVRQLTLTRLRNDRKDLGLDTIQDEENSSVAVDNEEDLKKLKDDFYVDLLVNTPGLESHSILSNAGPGGLDMFEDNMNPPNNQLNSKLSSLISERSQLVTRASPDEDRLLQLNKDIRALLLTS